MRFRYKKMPSSLLWNLKSHINVSKMGRHLFTHFILFMTLTLIVTFCSGGILHINAQLHDWRHRENKCAAKVGKYVRINREERWGILEKSTYNNAVLTTYLKNRKRIGMGNSLMDSNLLMDLQGQRQISDSRGEL